MPTIKDGIEWWRKSMKEREERGASQSKLKPKKQAQGGLTSLVEKMQSYSGDKKVEGGG